MDCRGWFSLRCYYGFFLFSSLLFWSQITQLKIQFSPEFIPLIEGVTVTEIDNDEAPSSKEVPDTGDLQGGQEMLLYEDGSIKEGRRVFDDEPGTEVIVSFNKARQASYVFKNNNVFDYAEGGKGNKIGSFSSPGFAHIDFVLPVNDRFMIVHGAMEDSPYPSERVLWQVEYDGLNKIQLSSNPYYSFVRPPKIFVSEDTGEQMLVYYTGSYDFAFGGDSSRPQYSILRLYNSLYPEGRDIIKFGFKAGTIIDASKLDNGYLLTADPSLPAMAGKPRVSPGKWKIVID